jgi:hypothetical protein
VKTFLSALVGSSLLAAGFAAFLASGDRVRAANAESLTGFYYTGENSTGGNLSQGANTPNVANSGTQDPYWSVTYASTNGGATTASAYVGTTYVINTTNTAFNTNGQYPNGYWAPETSSAEWITAPGAVWANNGNTATSGQVNSGGDGLPGYGLDSAPLPYTSTHAVIYVYTTTFTITGNGTTGDAITGLTMNLSVSADNNFAVFVNPTNTAAALATSSAKYVSPANEYTYAPLNVSLTSGFVIGVNTISIEVENSGGGTNVGNTNYSGVIVYGSGFVGLPETGTWLPLAAAAGFYAAWFLRRSRPRAIAALA